MTPILDETHHIDQTIYNRLQWLAGLMQDSEPGSAAKVKDYFVNAVHISGENYDQMRVSLIKQAASLKSRVDAKDIQVDLDFEGTMKKLYAKEIEAAQAKNAEPESAVTSPSSDSATSTPLPQN